MIRGRLRSVLVAGVSACVVSVALAGCGPSPKPEPPRTPDPIPTPLYTSDAKALAAAKDAYAKYIAVSNELAHAGWSNLDALDSVATGHALAEETKAGTASRAKGIRIEGDASAEVVALQQIAARSVVVYSCVDFTATVVRDSSGADVTNPNRTEIIPYEVTLGRRSTTLLVSKVEQWPDASIC